jgi:hypothetical protein
VKCLLAASIGEVCTRRLAYKLPEPRVAHDAAAPAPDVEPQALEAEEGVTIGWEVSRG